MGNEFSISNDSTQNAYINAGQKLTENMDNKMVKFCLNKKRFFLFFIFLNTIFSVFAMQNEKEIAHNEILKIANTTLKNNKFENSNIEKVKKLITENLIDPNFRIDIPELNIPMQKSRFISLYYNAQITLLHLTVIYGHKDLTNFLLEHGADSNICINNLTTPLKLSLINNNENKIEIFENLLKYKADINAEDYKHDFIINNAFAYDNILQILIENDIRINKKNSQILLENAICDNTRDEYCSYSKVIKDILHFTDASIDSNENTNKTIFHLIVSYTKYTDYLKAILNTTQTVLTHARPPEYHDNIQTNINNRMEWINKILQKPNKQGKTAYQIFYDMVDCTNEKNVFWWRDWGCHGYSTQILKLLDGSRLTNTPLKENPEYINT